MATSAGRGGKSRTRQSGTGGLYQRENGLWVGVVELRSGTGARRRKYVSAMKFADAQRKLKEAQRALAQIGDLPTATVTVSTYLTEWMRTAVAPNVRPNTAEQYRSDLKLHIIPEIGRYRLDQLTAPHVRAMTLAITDKGRSSTTALRCYNVLRKALDDAEHDGLVIRNVAKHVKAPRKAENTRGALTAAQGRALLASVAEDTWASARWIASLTTGARQGELLGLEWSRVSFETGLVDLSWQLQRLPHKHGCTEAPCGRKRTADCPQRRPDVPADFEYRHMHGGLYLTRPKTTSSYRVIPMTNLLAGALLALREMDGRDVGLVWMRGGRPVDPAADSKAWQAALAGAHLPPMPLHSARHTTASLYLEQRVDARVIADLLGHSSIVTTRGYQHATTALTLEAVSGINAALTTH